METEPTTQTIPKDTSVQTLDTQKSSKKIKRIILGILLLVILATIGTLMWHYISNKIEVENQKVEDEKRINQGPNKFMREQWKTYTDPDKNFTISIPSSWPVGQWSYAGGFYAYDDGSGGITLGKSYQLIPTGQFVTISDFFDVDITVNKPVSKYCNGGKPNTTISGFPASYDDTTGEWFINTNKADYFLAANYKGGEECGFGCPPNFVQPSISQNYIAANQAVINKVISSFKPLNQTSYSCN